MHILLADDLLDTRQLFALVFHLEGHSTTLAEDGQQAVEAVTQQHFDVLIIDAAMPVMDGFEAIRRIRQLPNGQKVPIILCTAYAHKEEDAADVGADVFMRKPILLRALVETVNKLRSK